MTCANHPDVPVAAYCQFCGKPLCAQCAHKIHGVVSCESCLAARLGWDAGFKGVEVNDNRGGYYREGQGSPYTSPVPFPPAVPAASTDAAPWLAFVLGFIPGVGAMYNGQFAKGLAHVAIFAVLIDLTNYNGLIGLLITAWVFYQVFDAYHTALARRDGLPLPNPLGLNDIGQWFGTRTIRSGIFSNPCMRPVPPANPVSTDTVSGEQDAGTSIGERAQPGFHAISSAAVPLQDRHRVGRPAVPTGAIVLVILGVVILLDNLGIFSMRWIDHGWPILLIGLGVFLIVRHRQTPPSGGVR